MKPEATKPPDDVHCALCGTPRKKWAAIVDGARWCSKCSADTPKKNGLSVAVWTNDREAECL